MPELFHVRRVTQGPFTRQELTGREIQLEAKTAPASQPGADSELQRLFPGGISQHGTRYMTAWPPEQKDINSWALEAFFEAVRRGEHPHRPSRMTSLFAFERLEDARTFLFNYGAAFAEIYRLDAEIAHRGNFELLKNLVMPVSSAYALASAYWNGEQGPAGALWEVLVELPVILGETVPL